MNWLSWVPGPGTECMAGFSMLIPLAWCLLLRAAINKADKDDAEVVEPTTIKQD